MEWAACSLIVYLGGSWVESRDFRLGLSKKSHDWALSLLTRAEGKGLGRDNLNEELGESIAGDVLVVLQDPKSTLTVSVGRLLVLNTRSWSGMESLFWLGKNRPCAIRIMMSKGDRAWKLKDRVYGTRGKISLEVDRGSVEQYSVRSFSSDRGR
jgi:hypothetical protein